MLDDYPLLVLAPIFAMVLNVFIHVSMSRFIRKNSQMFYLFLGFGCGLLCLLLFSFMVPLLKRNTDFFAYLGLDFIAYAALFYGYFHFVNINLASLRIRILREIYHSKQELSRDELFRLYNARQIIDNRLRKLVSSGQLIEKEGVYFIGKNCSFLLLFWFFEVTKRIVFGKGNRLLASVNK